jgi:hypothetical protein
MMIMDYEKQIEKHLKDSGGIITSLYCRENGIPTVYLSRLIAKGVLHRVDTGIYSTKNGDYDEFYFFQYKYSGSVFSYETALYLIGVTDKIIQVKDVTVSSKYKFNKPPVGVHVHYVKKEWLDLGVIVVKTMYGNFVRAYSYERTICDFILHKENMDPESYVKMLRGFSSYKNKNVHMLYEIAAKMGIASEVRDIIEVLL